VSKATPLLKDPRTRGRAYLEKQLKKKGFSRRKAVHILNILFAEIEQALARGEEVEFPFGKPERVRHKHGKTEGQFANGITTTYKQPFTVAHVMDAKGDELLRPKPKRIKIPLPPKPPMFFNKHSTRAVADVWRLDGN
jgi:nucleoid DNA-binding protein